MKNKSLEKEIASYKHGKVPRKLRRKQVLSEARALFTERGYKGASMNELARRVGVSKPVIYDLVGSKEQLFKDVMEEVSDALSGAVVTAALTKTDPHEQLRAGVLAFLRFVEDRREAWNVLLSVEVGPVSQELSAMRLKQAQQVAMLVMLGAQSLGVEPDPVTAEAIALAINGASEFLALWWGKHPEVSAEALADFLTQIFSSSLFLLSAEPLTSSAI